MKILVRKIETYSKIECYQHGDPIEVPDDLARDYNNSKITEEQLLELLEVRDLNWKYESEDENLNNVEYEITDFFDNDEDDRDEIDVDLE